MLKNDAMPDYYMAQFPGGGQRGFATALLLDWFEKKTELPTHQLFPYVTAGSVGILIVAALYLPHPQHPKSALMSARQLLEIFPEIASRLPKKPALFTNKNSREPLAEILEIFLGHGKLKDVLGTVFLSSHAIGGLSDSYKQHAKIINPKTGHITFEGNPETQILDIAYAGTALPSIYAAHDGHIDLAFSEVPAVNMGRVINLNYGMKGAFIRVGNFRSQIDKSRTYLYSSGFIRQASSSAITGAISDHAYAQTIKAAEALFGDFTYNLEQEISKDALNPPEILAVISTPEQFRRIRRMTETYISEHLELFETLAEGLKSVALRRLKESPQTAFGISPCIQEFPLPTIPSNVEKTAPNATLSAIWMSTSKLRWLGNKALQSAFDVAASAPVQNAVSTARDRIGRAAQSWDKKLFPLIHQGKGGELTPPPPEHR